MNKFFAFFLCILTLLPTEGFSQAAVSPDELPAFIAACADDASIDVDANFEGTLNGIFGDGGRVVGDAAIEATSSLSEFLSLFAQSDRPTMYQVYVECLNGLTVAPDAVSPEQSAIQNDILLLCIANGETPVEVVGIEIEGEFELPGDPLQLIGSTELANGNPLSPYTQVYFGESNSIYRQTAGGDFLPIMEQTSTNAIELFNAASQNGISLPTPRVSGGGSGGGSITLDGIRSPSQSITLFYLAEGPSINIRHLLSIQVPATFDDPTGSSIVFEIDAVIADCVPV